MIVALINSLPAYLGPVSFRLQVYLHRLTLYAPSADPVSLLYLPGSGTSQHPSQTSVFEDHRQPPPMKIQIPT